MLSPSTKALAIALIGIVAIVLLATLTRYSLIPSLGVQVEYSVFAVLAGIVIYHILGALASRIEETKLHFTFNKISVVLSVAIVSVGLLAIWIQQLTFLAISLGLVAAGVSFSLQQPITSLVGWLVLAFERPFVVGDRIEIRDIAGDVIDYGFFFIKVMEIRQWTDADLYTGRILLVPTNWILSNTIYNYSKDFGYIWDKLWIGLLPGADYMKVAQDIKEMAQRQTAAIVEKASSAYVKVRSKYFLTETNFEPQVFVSFNSNWIQLDLRYMAEIRNRAKMHSELSAMIIDYLANNGVNVASSSMNIYLTEKSKSVDSTKEVM